MLLELIVQGLIDRSSIDNSAIDFTPGDKKNFACTGATRLLYSKKNSKESRCKEKSNHPVSFNLVRDLKVICLYSRNSILFLLLRSFSLVVKLYVSFSYYHLVPSNRKRKKKLIEQNLLLIDRSRCFSKYYAHILNILQTTIKFPRIL